MSEEPVNFWGQLILQLRQEQGVSQRQLSAGSLVGRSTIRCIEKGQSKGDIYTIEKLLGYLGYELDAIPSESKHSVLRRQAEDVQDLNLRSRMAAKRLLSMKLDQ